MPTTPSPASSKNARAPEDPRGIKELSAQTLTAAESYIPDVEESVVSN